VSTVNQVPDFDYILDAGVPGAALAFYGRWWQLENWLREVVYVELHSRYGRAWSEQLEPRVASRAAGEERNHYMASADAGELLAYSDVSALFAIIEDHWELFAPLLPPQRRWSGTAEELRELRNRNAHCRRPHRDDLGRIEQVLRDLESGAWRFYSSYLNVHDLPQSRDPLSRAWVRGRHEAASRLLQHARDQYDTRFRLRYSVRPWAQKPQPSNISGAAGVLWHADWLIMGRDLNVADLWATIELRANARHLLVHLLFDLGRVTATFAAVDDPAMIADAIGGIFDSILISSTPFQPGRDLDEWGERCLRGADLLPRCVQVLNAYTTLDPHQQPFFLFQALSA
jgi:hypothetical protein